jgi:MOSC domain-containing protein YiiM
VPHVRSINLARSTPVSAFTGRPTAIGKSSVDGPVELREPGSKQEGLGSGLVGDLIGDHRHHGGSDQAVYAYGRESLDWWQSRLGRELPEGWFGENLTTVGLDVDHAVVGERWRVGADVMLQVTEPRIPCATFRGRMQRPGWVREFVAAQRPGTYLRVVTSGFMSRGDEVQVVRRPAHGVTVGLVFRALITERALLRQVLLAGDDLSEELRKVAQAGRRVALED